MNKESDSSSATCFLEGMTSINALIRAISNGSTDRRIIRIFFDQDKQACKARELHFLQHRASELAFTIELTSHEFIEKTAIGNTHGGILAECTNRNFPPPASDLIQKNGFYVYLDGIEDPYNFGYTLRSLYAAGVDGVILSPRNWMNAAGIVARASAGASELLPIMVADSEKTVNVFRANDYRIVAAGIRDSVSLYDANLTFPLLLIIGGEKRGISARLLSLVDDVVRIDYGRAFNGSLSAASAATVFAFEIFRKNR